MKNQQRIQLEMLKKIRCVCLALLCVLLFFIGATIARAEIQTAEVLTYNGQLRDDFGKPLQGYFDIRVSLWRKMFQTPEDVLSGRPGQLNLLSSNYLGFVENHTIETNKDGNYSIDIGEFAKFPNVQDEPLVFIQMEVKPQGTEVRNWEFIDMNPVGSELLERYPIFTDTIPPTQTEVTTFSEFSGALLDGESQPLQGTFPMRFSLWYSSNVDGLIDILSDGSLNTSSSNFVGYSNTVMITTTPTGYFTVPVGGFHLLPPEIFDHDLYVQIEVATDSSRPDLFEIIDPDGDQDTSVDRYEVYEGGLSLGDQQEPGTAQIAELGSNGRWLVSQIPNGTREHFFEVGAGGDDPNAVIEFRANQGAEKKGVLRYNGHIKKWEISSDGIHFCVINECIRGTTYQTFTIGLGDDEGDNWTLNFGDVVGADITFDAERDLFVFNKPIDLNQNELKNAVFDRRTEAPLNPVEGQIYYNLSDHKVYYFDGVFWKDMGNIYNVFGGGGGGGTTNITYTTINQLDYTGTPESTFTFDNDNTGPGTNITLVANQGTDPDGVLRYNATTNQWEIDNGTGTFYPIVDTATAQTLTNKTIDGDDNTLVDISFDSLKLREKTLVFAAEYDGNTIQQLGSDKGILRARYDETNKVNYYSWTSNQSTLNDIQVVTEIQLPEDFDSFLPVPISFTYRSEGTSTTDHTLNMKVFDSTDTEVTLTGATDLVSDTANTWKTSSISFSGANTFTAGGKMFIILEFSSKDKKRIEAGKTVLRYYGK